MSKTVFVVTEVGFEYNDEINSRPYGCENAGVPTVAYSTRAKANQEAMKLTIAKLKTENIGEYCYSLDEVISDYRGFETVIAESIGASDAELLMENLSDDPYEHSSDLAGVLNKLNEDQLTRLAASLDLVFHEVTEVELSDE